MAILRKAGSEVPPPGAGFVTVIEAEPGLAISVAKTDAVSFEELTKVVGRDLPFHLIRALDAKPVPFKASVNPGPPGATLAGTSGLSIRGTGLGVP